MGEIVATLIVSVIFYVIGLIILYFIVKAAVRNGTKEALKEIKTIRTDDGNIEFESKYYEVDNQVSQDDSMPFNQMDSSIKKRCENCGYKMSVNADFCTSCGATSKPKESNNADFD
jgi:rRNA maturation endonuclease Nob1